MRLNIRTLKGDTFTLDIDPAATFLQLKQQIKTLKGLPVEAQKVVYKGKAMENGHILVEIGVRDEDTLVLMQVVQRQGKPRPPPATVESEDAQNKGDNHQPNCKGKQERPEFEPKIRQLEDMGFPRDQSLKALTENDGDIEKALEALNASTSALQDLIKEEIFKVLQENEEGGELNIDLQSFVAGLGEKNEELKKILEEHPGMLNELLMQGLGQEGEEDSEMSAPLEEELEITEAEQESIQKLIGLGFEREDVIQVFFACDKNQELAANMLFDRLSNGDLDLAQP